MYSSALSTTSTKYAHSWSNSYTLLHLMVIFVIVSPEQEEAAVSHERADRVLLAPERVARCVFITCVCQARARSLHH